MLIKESSLERQWEDLADDKTVERTAQALKDHNITVYITSNQAEARDKVLQLIPKGSEVMTSTSMTLEVLGLVAEFNDSGHYDSARKKIASLDKDTSQHERLRLGMAPEYMVGSVHAVTEDGHVLVASRTGSQLPAYSYGATHVVWVVGTQKIVRDINEGLKRIYEHALPLEDNRAQRAYGVRSGVNKILIITQELTPGRISLVFIKELLGF